jgi:hypothetical protein
MILVLAARTRSARMARRLAEAALLLALVGCMDVPTHPYPSAEARLHVRASVAGTPIRAMAVEVTAADIAVPLVFNLEIVDGLAIGALTVPAGTARMVTGRAFDAAGVETHRGSQSATIRPGANDPLTVTLSPLRGEQPVVVVVGSYSVAITPAAATLAVGGTVGLTASIRDADGVTIQEAPQWATLDPGIASVNGDGLVSAHAVGEARIVAVFAGIAAVATVTVTGP